VLYDKGKWAELLNVYNTVIYHAKRPEDVIEAYLTKGYVLDARMGLVDKASQHYQKTLAFDPDQIEALMRLAELAVRKEEWVEAASLADRAMAQEVDDSRRQGCLLALKAVASQAIGDGERAEAAYQEAREVDPALAEALGETGITDFSAVHSVLKTTLQTTR